MSSHESPMNPHNSGGGSQPEEICYKVAGSQSERAGAFRLVHSAYLRSRLIDPNPFGMRVLRQHLLSSAEVFIATLRGEVISTVSLIGDGQLGLPMEAVYSREVSRLRDQGIRLAEVSSLADRRRQLVRTLPVFIQLTRLLVQYARRQGIERLLVAVHPRHSRFYQRFLCFEPVGEERIYPLVRNSPAVALGLDFARIDSQRPVNYDTFFARAIPDEQLAPQPISLAERLYFAPAAALCGHFTPIGSHRDADGDSDASQACA